MILTYMALSCQGPSEGVYDNPNDPARIGGPDELTVVTESPSQILARRVVIKGHLVPDPAIIVKSKGFCISQSMDILPFQMRNCVFATGAGSEFQATFANLNPDTKYYVQAFARNDRSLFYGDFIEFRTADGRVQFAPLVDAGSRMPLAIREYQVEISDLRGVERVNQIGICYYGVKPGILNSTCRTVNVSNRPGDYLKTHLVSIPSLPQVEVYHVVPFALTDIGVNYGPEIRLEYEGPDLTLHDVDVETLTATTLSVSVRFDKRLDTLRIQEAGFIVSSTITNTDLSNWRIGSVNGDRIELTMANLLSGRILYVQPFVRTHFGIWRGSIKRVMTSCADEVTDRDGNRYGTVGITVAEISNNQSQCWLDRNLRVTRFNNGVELQRLSPTEPQPFVFGYYVPDMPGVTADYGYTYTIMTASNWQLEVCPVGWRVPTIQDVAKLFSLWQARPLRDLMATGEAWLMADGTNLSGFNALPSVYRLTSTQLEINRGSALWWIKDYEVLRLNPPLFTRSEVVFEHALPIRCVRND